MNRRVRLFPYAVLLLLAWGALAFGAEFTWAYTPLLVFSVTVASLGLLARSRANGVRDRALILALVFFLAATVLQVIPLPAPLVNALSPARDDVDYSRLFATVTMQDQPAPTDRAAPRPLSIAPSRTWLGLAFISAYAALLAGCVSGFGGVGTRRVVRGIVILGAIVAFAEIIQKASGSSIIYGVFTPRQLSYDSAPFVNRNHTAGWLIMAIALTLGHLTGSVAHGTRGESTWRGRVLWLSSPRGSEVMLTAFVIGVMAIAVVFSASRSGTLCLLLVSLVFGLVSLRRGSWWRRMFGGAHLAAVLIAAAVMGGAGGVGQRFGSANLANLDGRFDVWRDTVRIIQDFPITGTGLNTYGISMLHYQRTQHGGIRYIEAHNDYLQLAAEGGLLLLIPALVLSVATIASIRRRFLDGHDDDRTHWARVGAVCGLLALAFQSIVDFTLQMPGAAVLFVVLIAIALHRPPERVSRP